MRCRFLAVSVIAALSASQGQAQTNIASEGRAIAVKQCSECHAIGRSDSDVKNAAAPSFVSIAGMPSTTALSIKVFLRSPHANMPNIMFTDSELDAITGYILSLKGN
jgi:mono/diheme cytochrome c family protein